MKRVIPFQQVVEAVSALCGKAAVKLPADVLEALQRGAEQEKQPLAKSFFDQYLENAEIAISENMPLCQDTGFAVFFVEYGENVQVDGEGLAAAINAGVREGYAKYYLRKSIVAEPLFDRINTKDNTPAVIHFTPVPGDSVKIVLAPKGGGSENMSALKMMKLDFGSVTGILCGSMANPMALNYANETIEGDNPAVAYATVYPACMFLRVIIIQLVIMFLVK